MEESWRRGSGTWLRTSGSKPVSSRNWVLGRRNKSFFGNWVWQRSSHTLFLFDFFKFLDIHSLIYIVYYTMVASTKKAEEKQKLVGVPSEESKDKYKEDSAIALEELQASQHRKKTIVKERRTWLRAKWALSE